MNIHVNTISQCTGQHHRFINVTVAGVTTDIVVDREDFSNDFTDRTDIENAVKDRLRSALKEGGATLTLATWKTVLEGKDFKI